MKQITPLAFIVLIASLAQADTCKYGLGYTYGTDSCSVRETEALQRVAAAKTICSSANSEVLWRKGGKEPTWAWTAISKGSYSAMKGFTSAACEGADLVVKFTYDDVANTVRLTVTDAESGSTVFEETRTVADLGSDVVRMADHWHGMVADARAAAMAAEEVERSRERQAKLDEEFRQCQIEFDSLKELVCKRNVDIPKRILGQLAELGCTHRSRQAFTLAEQPVEGDGAFGAVLGQAADDAVVLDEFLQHIAGQNTFGAVGHTNVDLVGAGERKLEVGPQLRQQPA